MKKLLCVVAVMSVTVASLALAAFPIPFASDVKTVSRDVPDQISDSGVTINFSSQGCGSLMVEDGKSIQEVAEVASDWIEKYVRPNVEAGTVTPRVFYVLNFCLEAFDVQAQKLRSEVTTRMDASGKLAEASQFLDVKLESLSFEGADSLQMRQTLMQCHYEPSSELESYCTEYNYGKQGCLIRDYNAVQNLLDKWRELEEEYGSAVDRVPTFDIDPLIFKSRTDGGKLWGRWWSLVRDYMGNSHWWWLPVNVWDAWKYIHDEKWRLIAIDLTDDDVRKFETTLGNRSAYEDVVTASDGDYQKAYMDLARVCHLISDWQRTEWRGENPWTDSLNRDLSNWYEKMMVRSRDTLKGLEDRMVNYPLMGNLAEATLVNLYLCVLDFEWNPFGERGEEIRKLREEWLANAEKIGDLSSKYCRYSTTPMARLESAKYNFFFEQTYATNRLNITELKDPDAVRRFKESNQALFDDREKHHVRDGLVQVELVTEYDRIFDAYENLRGNAFDRDFAEVCLGKDVVEAWMKDVSDKVPERWMYPSWSREVQEWGTPAKSTEVVYFYDVCRLPVRRLDRMQLLLCAVQNTLPESDMKVMEDIFKGYRGWAKNEESAKEKFVSFVNRKKLSPELEQVIQQSFGSVEGFVDQWFKCLNSGFDAPNADMQSAKPKSVKDVAERLSVEFLPLWKKIDEADWKWWRWLF